MNYAIEVFTKVDTSVDSNHIRRLIKDANYAYDFSRWVEAYELYKKIEELAPLSSVNIGHVFYRLGMIHHVNSSNLNQLQNLPDIASVTNTYFGKAFVELVKIAEEGDAEAQADLGYMYYNGHTAVGSDVNLALKYYHMAGEQGYSRALCNLGYIYFNSHQPSDKKLAIEYYKKAAVCGSLVAHSNLGFIYKDSSEDVPRNYDLAIKHFFTAARGNEKAKNHLEAVFNGDFGEEYLRVAKNYLNSSWKIEFQVLHPECRATILEIFSWTRPNTFTQKGLVRTQIEERGLLVELADQIAYFIVAFWNKNHFKTVQSS